MVGKNIWIDNHVLGGMINSDLIDSVAFFCQLKCVKHHPVFLRSKTKKGKYQSPIVSISRETNISYGTIKKHFDNLINWGLMTVYDDKIIMSSSEATSEWARNNMVVTKRKENKLGKKQYKLNCKKVSSKGDYKIVVNSVKIVSCIKVQEKILQKAETYRNIQIGARKGLADASSNIFYPTLSNKSIAKKSNRKSISTGHRHKAASSRLELYGNIRKDIILEKDCSRQKFDFLKMADPDKYSYAKLYNGYVLLDVSSELFLFDKNGKKKGNENKVEEEVLSVTSNISMYERAKTDKFGFFVSLKRPTQMDSDGFICKEELLKRRGWSEDFLLSEGLKKSKKYAEKLKGWDFKKITCKKTGKEISVRMFTMWQVMDVESKWNPKDVDLCGFQVWGGGTGSLDHLG